MTRKQDGSSWFVAEGIKDKLLQRQQEEGYIGSFTAYLNYVLKTHAENKCKPAGHEVKAVRVRKVKLGEDEQADERSA